MKPLLKTAANLPGYHKVARDVASMTMTLGANGCVTGMEIGRLTDGSVFPETQPRKPGNPPSDIDSAFGWNFLEHPRKHVGGGGGGGGGGNGGLGGGTKRDPDVA